MGRAAAGEKRAVGAAGEEHRARAAGLGFAAAATRVGLGGAGSECRAILGERARSAIRVARATDGRADIHQRLGEIAGPSAAARARAPPTRSRAFAWAIGASKREKPRENPGDIAVDRQGLAAKGDRRDRRRGIGADAGQGAQFGFLARKSPAAPSDLPRAGMQVPRPRIIAEAGKGADHGLGRGGGQILDASAISR